MAETSALPLTKTFRDLQPNLGSSLTMHEGQTSRYLVRCNVRHGEAGSHYYITLAVAPGNRSVEQAGLQLSCLCS